MHNKVNERLNKPIFDCAHLDDEYDCGCGDDSGTPRTSPYSPSLTVDIEAGRDPEPTKDGLTGAHLIKGGR